MTDYRDDNVANPRFSQFSPFGDTSMQPVAGDAAGSRGPPPPPPSSGRQGQDKIGVHLKGPRNSVGELENYCYRTFKPVDPVLSEILQRSKALGLPSIFVGGMEGLTMEIMIRMAGYKKVVEIGTLGGFSGVVIARALGSGGVLHTIECEPRFVEIALESFEKAGLSDVVKMHHGKASDILEQLSAEGPFDAVFIDADKVNYPTYLDWVEKNLRVGGAVFADNTFGFGHVWREHIADERLARDVGAIKVFNSRLANSPHFRATLVPFSEGLTVALRIS